MKALVGTWRGDARGEPGAGKVERAYRFALGGRYLEVHNRSVYPPSNAKPTGEIHEDVGFYSHDAARKALVLRQFHIEGFVSQYASNPQTRRPSSSSPNRSRTFRAASAPEKRSA